MIEPITIRFATAGIPEVSAAFARVESQAKKFEGAMTTTAEKGGRSRIGVADKEARDKIRAYQKVDKEVEKAQRDATRELEREQKRRGDIVRRSSEMAGRDAVKAARDEARETEKIREQNARQYIRMSEERSRALEREAAEATKAQRKIASGAGKYAKTWGGRIGGMATALGATAGIGGAFMVAGAAKQEYSDERNAAQLVNLVTSGTKVPEGANVKNILGQAGAVSRETGISRGEIVEASKTYAKNAQHGDFKGVMGNMGLFAKLAKVTGADMGSIAEAAGTLQSQNPDLDPAAMKQMLLDANEMSKQGKMSFSESLAQMGKVGSSRSSYGGNVANTQRTLIGYAQLAKSAGTSEEVGTFVSALAAEATVADSKFFKDTKKREGKGRHLYKMDEFGRIATPDSLVEDVYRNTHGNISEIKSLMGRRGSALFGETEQAYINAAGKGNDVEAGIKGVKEYMGQVTGARGTEEGLNAQFKQSMDTPGEKFTTAINSIEETLMEKLAPALETFANKLGDPAVTKDIDGLISAFSALASFLIDLGPYKGIAAIIGARVVADVAQAAIGEGVKNIMIKQMSASLSDKMMTGVSIAAATLIVASLMTPVGSSATGGAVAAGDKDAAALASGMVSPKDVAVQADRAALAKRQAELKNLVEHPVDSGGNKPLLGDTVAKLAAKPFTALGFDTFENQLSKVTESLKRLDAAAKAAGTSVPAAVPAVTAGAPAAPTGSHARS